MLEFYEFNTFNMMVVLISTFVIYYLLSKTISDKKVEKDDNFSLEYLIVSTIISIIISIVISYIMTGKDEAILVDDYWENTEQFE